MSEKPIFITKTNGEREPFDIEKLERSLKNSHVSPAIVQEVSRVILRELEDGMSTHDIYRHAFEVLHGLEKRAAVRYSLKKAVLDLGPSGFPFEKFVAEIFKHKGYQVKTDQVVQGFCAEHEVDVVAHKPNDLIMVEAKFHNQPGIKSDLKVVLYVKARFEDLAQATFNYGQPNQRMTEGWLVTNTKFTVSAIKYAECQHMKIIGWNYPLNNNLQDLIEEAHLHPITSLRSLSDLDKKDLLRQGIVLCKSLLDQKVLRSLHLTEAHTKAVLDEIFAMQNGSAQV